MVDGSQDRIQRSGGEKEDKITRRQQKKHLIENRTVVEE